MKAIFETFGDLGQNEPRLTLTERKAALKNDQAYYDSINFPRAYASLKVLISKEKKESERRHYQGLIEMLKRLEAKGRPNKLTNI